MKLVNGMTCIAAHAGKDEAQSGMMAEGKRPMTTLLGRRFRVPPAQFGIQASAKGRTRNKSH